MKTLPRTLAQVRDYEVSQIGVRGIPNDHWPLTYGNDCLKFQLFSLGVAARQLMTNPTISIGAWLGATDWQRIPTAELRPGDLVLQQWDDNPDVDHVGLLYSHTAAGYRTVEANTSPRPGMLLTPSNRGIFEKVRPAGSWLRGGVRPPYKPEAAVTTSKQRDEVRLVLAWLDTQLPDRVRRSAAGPIGKAPGDGVMGPVAWLEVQEWGDLPGVGLYPSPPYQKDGVPGGRTKFVYGEALKRARAARK